MTPIQVIGIGLDGAAGLTAAVRQQVAGADILVGSQRHLAYFPDHRAERWPLDDLSAVLARLQSCLQQLPCPRVVILTSGDPLFFGLGRLLLTVLPAEQLTFHPHLSSVQLAFSRLKLPWQDACLISIHGRDWESLMAALIRGEAKIAVLSDPLHSPIAIARLVLDLNLPYDYRIWVCENLGGADERLGCFNAADLSQSVDVSPLNVVVLLRETDPPTAEPPLLGIPDRWFAGFPDRPGLITKRELRVLILAELGLYAGQTVWDIGAGTGSVSLEIARLVPSTVIYAIEKTAIGCRLIAQNCQRLAVSNVQVVAGAAPGALTGLPAPDRVFIGGSSGNLMEILTHVADRLPSQGRMVVALATLESLTQLVSWQSQTSGWQHRILQIQVSRSVAVGPHSRFAPLNPLAVATLTPCPQP
jgi:precorrin-6Y C5,15-methyltransferase (decarboxylating)